MLNKFFNAGLTLVIALLLTVALYPFGNSTDISKVDNFSLKDYKGELHELKDYKNAKAIILMFISTQCPVSNAYNTRMAELYKKYKDKGVVFLGINSNKAENVSEIATHAKGNGFEFTILKDEKNKIADKLEATVTPEIYALNNNFEVLYHGRIDVFSARKSLKKNFAIKFK